MGCRRAGAPALAFALAASAAPGALRAQATQPPADTLTAPVETAAGDTAVARPRYETELLPPEHWAVRAAERATALGLTRLYLPAQRAPTRLEVERALADAAWRADSVASPALVALARGWQARFREEFGGAARVLPGTGAALRYSGAASAGAAYARGRAAAGTGISPSERTGAASLPDENATILGARFAASLGSWLDASARPELRGTVLRLPAADLSLGAGPLSLRLVRGPVRYGFGRGGGVVLGGNEPLTGLDLLTREPVRLPLLRFLGPTAFAVNIARFDFARHPGAPWFLATSATFQPHRRFDLQLNRAFLFGGPNGPITVPLLLNMLVGYQGGGERNVLFANQVASVAFRYRLPSEALLPATLYAEWGLEDGSGAWRDVPGVVLGTYLPALPGLPAVAAGVEYTSYAPSCCGNPPWARHGGFTGGWASKDLPLGHPLGGEGREVALYADADLLDARLRVEGRVFSRFRGAENLFSPERLGFSRGFAARAAFRPRARVEASLAAFLDAGRGWTQHDAEVRISSFF